MKQWGTKEFWGLDSSFDPDWVLTPPQIELRTRLIEVCRTTIRPQAIRSDKTYEFPRESIDALAGLGILGLLVPKELGGLGENHVCLLMVIETVSRYGGASTGLILVMHQLTVASMVMFHKGNRLFTDLLKRLDKDKLLGAVATSDPSTGGHYWCTISSKLHTLPNDMMRVLKFASWCTSAGFADFYVVQVASSIIENPLEEGSSILVFKDEVRASSEEWKAMGVRGNQSGPLMVDEVLPQERIIGYIGASPKIFSEVVPIFNLGIACNCNGVAMSALDIAKRHLLGKTHGDVGVRVAEYPIIQDSIGRCITSTNSCRTSAFFIAQALDRVTDNCDWSLNYNNDLDNKLREFSTRWGLEVKHNSSENAAQLTDEVLKCCGGDGYKEELGLERILRDSKSGTLNAPSNEIIRNMLGKTALLGEGSVDLWEKNCNHMLIHHEVKKMSVEEKKHLMKRLSEDIKNEEDNIILKHPYQDTDFDNPFSVSAPAYNKAQVTTNDGVTHSAGLSPECWNKLKLTSKTEVNETMTSFQFALPTRNDHTGCYPGQYLQVKVLIDGKYHIRSFSPVSTPNDYGKLEIVIKFESHGVISNFFKNLAIGSDLEFLAPCGGFEYEPNKLQELTIFASGAGITPGLQLIRSVASNPSDKTKINLIYYSESFDKILYYDELKKYTDNDPRIHIVFTLGEVPQNWDGEEGFINEKMIKNYTPKMNGLEHKIMMCGGPSMTIACLHSLRVLEYPPEIIFIYGQVGTEQLRMVYGKNIKLSGHRCDNVV